MSERLRNSRPQSAGRPLGSLGHLLERPPGEGRGVRLAIVVAVVLHAAVFAINWPTIAQSKPRVMDCPVLRPVEPNIKYLPPEPRIRELPRPPVWSVPVPDPTPLDPEPIRHEVEPTTDIPIDPAVVFGSAPIPEPPPDPAPPGPIVVGLDVDPPEVVHRVLPRYPELARTIRYEGAVILELIIDTEGKVEEIAVLKGLPYGITESAVEAVRQWRFEPCTLDGRPVAVQYNLTVWFRLQ
jgi:protein TonB